MSDFNMNNQYAPQQPQYAAPQYGAPVAPAPAKKAPTKLIAIIVAAVVALVAIFAIGGNSVPGVVKDAVKDYFEDRAEVGSLKCEYKQSKDGATFYVISGKIKDVEDDDFEDYKDGYFIGVAYKYDGEAKFTITNLYEKDEKDDFKDELKEGIEDIKDNKDEIDDILEALADED